MPPSTVSSPPAADISVVIPTHDRPASLLRLLRSVAAQTLRPREVVIAAAGVSPDPAALRRVLGEIPLLLFAGERSVCRQRNEGIRRAGGSHVLLCDDDIELPPGALARLWQERESGGETRAVCGVLVEEGMIPTDRLTISGLFWRRLFLMGVWGDVNRVAGSGLLADALRRHYRRVGNGVTPAGWPLLTQWEGPCVRTLVYGLGGGALVPRSWLLASPYDELLERNGIGDNYGVALGFPGAFPIAVLTGLSVTHHRESSHRVDAATAYEHRVLALDYFGSRTGRLGRMRLAALCWSLLGHAVAAMAGSRWNEARATTALMARVGLGRNPYRIAARTGKSGPVDPSA
jgi:glycosyltransferase involved in cell wall biosynthesis